MVRCGKRWFRTTRLSAEAEQPALRQGRCLCTSISQQPSTAAGRRTQATFSVPRGRTPDWRRLLGWQAALKLAFGTVGVCRASSSRVVRRGGGRRLRWEDEIVNTALGV